MPLVLVPTPIGNLEDITLRALRMLRAADLIACEDTRRSMQLLNRYGIRAPLLSCHEHNERERVARIMELLGEGKTVALVSDAGMPGISDPGEVILAEALQQGYEVDVLPGASAVLPALLLSGLPARTFVFAGFPPDARSDREAFFEQFRERPETLVFYLSPHKAAEHLRDARTIFGERPAAIVREISKIHQEVLRGTLGQLAEKADEGLRGELALVVAGYAASQHSEEENTLWCEEAFRLMKGELPLKEVARRIAERYGIPKNRVKDFLIAEQRAEEAGAPGKGEE